jgi:hypothetical protein
VRNAGSMASKPHRGLQLHIGRSVACDGCRFRCIRWTVEVERESWNLMDDDVCG